jgi:signal transduction histidine kinase
MKSLAARLFLILVLVTLGIQVFSFGGVVVLMGREGRTSMNEFMATDVVFTKTRLQNLPQAERSAQLNELNQRGQYRLTLEDVGEASHPSLASAALEDTAAVLQKHLGQAGLRSDKPARPILWRPQDEACPAIELPFNAQQNLIVSFPGRKPPFAPPSMSTALVYLLVVSLLVMAAAWWAVRLATRPLTRLANAAQSLGQNLDAPPLPETGPSEVRRASSAFNTMQRAIQAHLNERTQILASISHDLKTPLTRLRLRLGTLPEGEDRQRLEQDIDAMNLLIQEGLDYAHSSQLREPLVPVDVNALLETVVERYTDMGQSVQLEGNASNPVQCAPRALERALQNLVDNAVKYGERARIQLRQDRQTLHIRIEDDGPGVPPALLDKILEPFFRTETSRNRDTGGTGLGLAIAHNLLRAQGAQLSLTNREPQGLVATVVFART